MSTKTCRDCGNVLDRSARGCPRCALNFEAESMVNRFVLGLLLAGLLLVVVVIVAFFYLSR
jgi:hypothetical protein